MIDSTFEVSPKQENISQKIHSPLSLIISPCEIMEEKAFPLNPEEFPRCKKCGSYFSSLCEKTETSWKCALCKTENECGKIPEIKTERVWFDLKENKNKELLVFYLSRTFCKDDLNIIKPFLSQFVAKLKGANCLFFVSSNKENENSISLLCPHYSQFMCIDGKITENKGKCEENNAPAPLSVYEDFETIDLAAHIFSAEQLESASMSINLLQPTNGTFEFSAISAVAFLVASHFHKEKIRLVSIIPGCDDKESMIKCLKDMNVRIDVLVPEIDIMSQKLMKELPGIVVPFSRYDLRQKLEYLIKAQAEYQVYMNVRSSGCLASWYKLPILQSVIEGNMLYSASVREHQPFALEIKTEGNTSSAAIVQVTIKSTDKLIILNKKIEYTNDKKAFAASINISALQWTWMVRSIGKPGALYAVTDAAKSLAAFLEENQREHKDLDKFIEIIKNLQCFKNAPSLTILLLVVTFHSFVKFIPVVSGEKKQRFAYVLDELYADGSSRELIRKIKEIGICGQPLLNVQEWCL